MINLIPDTKPMLSGYEDGFVETFRTFSQSKSIDKTFHQALDSLLETSYTTPHHMLRVKAENELEIFQQSIGTKGHLIAVFQMLYLIDKNDKNTFDKYYTYVLGYIKRSGKLSDIGPQDHLQILACVVCCIITKEMSFKLREKLVYCFEQLIQIESNESDTVKLTIGSFLIKNLGSLQSHQLGGALMILQHLVNSFNNQDFCIEASRAILAFGEKIVLLTANINSLNYEEAFEVLNMLSTIAAASSKLIAKFASYYSNLYSDCILISEGFLVFFDKIITMDFFNTGSSLICFHDDPVVCEVVNSMKANIIRGISKVAESIYRKGEEHLRFRPSELDSPEKKKSTLFHYNMIKYLLKELHASLKIASEKNIVLTDEVKWLVYLLLYPQRG